MLDGPERRARRGAPFGGASFDFDGVLVDSPDGAGLARDATRAAAAQTQERRAARRIHVSPARRHNHAKRALYLPPGNTDQDPATTPCWLNLSTGSHHAPLSSGFGEDWSRMCVTFGCAGAGRVGS